ncbi:hypothetical protein EVAR_103484_1 [Eumeta japonica]|uniref:Uncharacterized protein n=1 Tax=Eumeta variegata TaxID=151549 RepID=A0A4C1ZLD6_EUMVA|nr:hypothetical protein EVAR_103484_1 [Eumeta japonica]
MLVSILHSKHYPPLCSAGKHIRWRLCGTSPAANGTLKTTRYFCESTKLNYNVNVILSFDSKNRYHRPLLPSHHYRHYRAVDKTVPQLKRNSYGTTLLSAAPALALIKVEARLFFSALKSCSNFLEILIRLHDKARRAVADSPILIMIGGYYGTLIEARFVYKTAEHCQCTDICKTQASETRLVRRGKGGAGAAGARAPRTTPEPRKTLSTVSGFQLKPSLMVMILNFNDGNGCFCAAACREVMVMFDINFNYTRDRQI